MGVRGKVAHERPRRKPQVFPKSHVPRRFFGSFCIAAKGTRPVGRNPCFVLRVVPPAGGRTMHAPTSRTNRRVYPRAATWGRPYGTGFLIPISHSSVMPAFSQASMFSLSHREDCTSPMWALFPSGRRPDGAPPFHILGRNQFALRKFLASLEICGAPAPPRLRRGLGKAHRLTAE